jgi:putative hydrolase of the HAD superfamily
MIRVVLFDFGGVLAAEGFREGLKAIARRHGRDPEPFFETGRDLVYSTGYATGNAGEAEYWEALRMATGISLPDEELREEILGRFILNPEMMNVVQELKREGYAVGILSDQTNWLEELDRKYRFLRHFDPVFNSFHLHKSKKDPTLFEEVSKAMGRNPEEVLFIDDSEEHVGRASSRGLKCIHFRGMEQFRRDLDRILDQG